MSSMKHVPTSTLRGDRSPERTIGPETTGTIEQERHDRDMAVKVALRAALFRAII